METQLNQSPYNEKHNMHMNNPDKKAQIYIISSNEQVELKWLQKALEFFDRSKIKFVEARNL